MAEGSTSAEFAFTTPFEADYEFTGVWTVNGVEFSFDAINQLADILDAVTAGNEIALQEALDAAGITYADEAKIGDYLDALTVAALTVEDTLADVQEVIDGVDEADAEAEADAAKVKAVVDATTQKQLLDTLTANFNHVNTAWIVDYANETVVVGEDELGADIEVGLLALNGTAHAVAVSVEDIQEAIYAVNGDKIVAANNAASTAADQAKVTALIEAWVVSDDSETPEVTPKADAIEASKVKEAAFKVAEAKTANTLYNTLVSYANLVEDDSLKASDLNASNKSFYFEALEAENVRTGLVAAIKAGSDDIKTTIVVAGNQAAAGSAIEAITGADTADKLLAALKSLGLDNVVDANKAAYYVTDNANFSAVGNKDEAQGVVDAINDAEEFKTTYATVLDLTTEDVVADDLADVKAAVKAFDALSDDAAAFLGTEGELIGNLETAVEGKFLADVNLIAGEGNMSEKLDVLGNSFYSKLTVEQKKEVAKLFIVTNDTEGADGYTDFATFDQIQPALNTAIATYKALLDEVNAAETKAAMKVAIGKVATAAGLSPTDTELTLMADIAFDQKPEAGYKTVAEILSVIQ